MSKPHLVVCISGHGYGHVAQTAPVLNELARLVPGLRLTLRTSVPLEHLKSRIQTEFHYVHTLVDPGMEMVSALEVDSERSLRAYADFHRNWERRVAEEERLLARLAPDAVLTNVAYLPLIGAARRGVPALAMCSLNWADIFDYFCADMPGAAEIGRQIRQAYRHAEIFLRLTPGMPMEWMPHLQETGPVARSLVSRREHINRKLGLGRHHKLVLVSMGGIAMRMPMESWPRIPDVLWLVPDDWQCMRDDCISLGLLSLDFYEVLASCDVLLTKPGYGSFVEAACSGIPVLYAKRRAWPEQEALIAWLEAHGACAELASAQLQTGEFAGILSSLLQQGKPLVIEPSGTETAANHIAGLLGFIP
jgi:UDP:flavonoid glycosyltransferase YjiC (YdhE family)